MLERPVPGIQGHQVLVRVEAFGVGIHDRYFIPVDATFPYVIGSEGAGVISALGADVTGFQLGDRVIFASLLQSSGGCWAELVAVAADALVRLPETLEMTEAASIPIAGKTALECIHTLKLTASDSLFVAGASGAIGTLVIQLAAELGAQVIGSASRKNHDYLRSLGCEFTVDYSDADWVNQIRENFPEGVTAALAIQPRTAEDSMRVVRDGGRVITVSGDQITPERGIEVRQFAHLLNMASAVSELVEKIQGGRLRLVIEQIYPFSQAIEALEKTETRHARGKVVVRVS